MSGQPLTEPAEPEWLTAAEIATRARMHPQTVYRAMRSGKLRATQFVRHGNWRAHVDDVDAWLHGVRPAAVVPLRRSA